MERARDALNRFFNLYNLEAGREWSEFFSRWVNLVGEDLASHTRVSDVKNGAVIVEVDHPGWMQLLQMRRGNVLAEIARRYPQLGIRSMHMRLVREGLWTASRPPAAKPPAPVEPSRPAPEAGPPPPLQSPEVKDPAFKELLDKLGKAVEKRRRGE